TGKSLAMYMLAKRCLSDATWLPIILRPGSEPWDQDRLRDGIEKILSSTVYGLSAADQEKIRNHKMLFLFDAYDELRVKGPRQNLPSLLGLHKWPNAKLIATSRLSRDIVNNEGKIFDFQN